MSREILFRGLDHSGVWRTGDLINWNCERRNEWCSINEGIVSHPVHQLTVGQYTGLKDKNGDKIFAGDKIKDEEHFHYTVYWSNNNLSWMIDGENLADFKDCEIEIIGNIHCNELNKLKEQGR